MLRSVTSSAADRPGRRGASGALERRDYGWVGTFEAMASPCEVHVAGADQDTAARVVAGVRLEATRIEQKFSRYRRGNVVDRINCANGEPVAVDAETVGLLDYADRLFELSGGRFDITSGALRRVWRFDGGDGLPSPAEVDEVLRHVGWKKARWRAPELSLPAGMEIDLGGIGKEYAVDRAAEIARSIWPRGLINFGGDLAAFGEPIDRGGWRVGVERTDGQAATAAQIRLAVGALATSGDARRYLTRDGKRYGHILDPRTGWPVENAPRSVTVAAPTCTLAGMLATLAMLNGADAEAFLDAENVDYWCLR